MSRAYWNKRKEIALAAFPERTEICAQLEVKFSLKDLAKMSQKEIKAMCTPGELAWLAIHRKKIKSREYASKTKGRKEQKHVDTSERCKLLTKQLKDSERARLKLTAELSEAKGKTGGNQLLDSERARVKLVAELREAKGQNRALMNSLAQESGHGAHMYHLLI